jgi:hypothetical protein
VDSVSLQDGGTGSPLLRSPLPFRSPGEWKGARGKVREHLPPSSPAAWERKGGWRGKVRAVLSPSSPAAWERKGGWGEGEGASRTLHRQLFSYMRRISSSRAAASFCPSWRNTRTARLCSGLSSDVVYWITAADRSASITILPSIITPR